MVDIALDATGDILVTTGGDISLTNSARQAALIRLRWFLGEWRLAPSWGLPYFEELFIKSPPLTLIKRRIYDALVAVDGIDDTTHIEIAVDSKSRVATISFNLVVGEETYREEVQVNG